MAGPRAAEVLITDRAFLGGTGPYRCPALPNLAVVIVARRVHPGLLRTGLGSGALGFVLEDVAELDLAAGIRAAVQGHRYLSSAITQLLIDSCARAPLPTRHADPLAALTPREREVLRLIAQGHRSHEIARVFGIARATVATHRRSLMAKLGVHKTTQLVRLAVRHGVAS